MSQPVYPLWVAVVKFVMPIQPGSSTLEPLAGSGGQALRKRAASNARDRVGPRQPRYGWSFSGSVSVDPVRQTLNHPASYLQPHEKERRS